MSNAWVRKIVSFSDSDHMCHWRTLVANVRYSFFGFVSFHFVLSLFKNGSNFQKQGSKLFRIKYNFKPYNLVCAKKPIEMWFSSRLPLLKVANRTTSNNCGNHVKNRWNFFIYNSHIFKIKYRVIWMENCLLSQL